jgi:plasmid stabilization system protein ParE
MEVRWSPEAADDLERIIAHVRRDNPLAARRIADIIYQRCGDLRMFPNRGRQGRVEGTRELVLAPASVYRRVSGQDGRRRNCACVSWRSRSAVGNALPVVARAPG